MAILRKGEYIGTVETSEATENSLTEMMVGKKVELNIARSAPVNPVKRLSVSHLTVYNREEIKVLDDVSFDVFGGEILGIAGISGNGQKELLEAIAGLQITAQGSSIEFYEKGKEDQPLQLVGKTPKKNSGCRCASCICSRGSSWNGTCWFHGYDGKICC